MRYMTTLSKFYREMKGGKTALLLSIADECDCSVNCVLRWVQGFNKTNDPKRIEVLSKMTGIPADKLFERI